MRAVKNNLPTPSGEVGELDDSRPGYWHISKCPGRAGEKVAQSRIDQATLENVMGIGKVRAGGDGMGCVSTLNYAVLPLKGRAAGADRVMELGVGVSLNIRFERRQDGLVSRRILAHRTDGNKLLQNAHLLQGCVQILNGFI
jgi:hypothetical protein